MKVVHCRDIGFDCDDIIHAQSEGKLLRQAAEHARTQHGVQVTPELATQVLSHIHDEDPQEDISPTP